MEQNKMGMESLYIPKEIMKHIQNGELTLQEGIILSIIDFLDSRGECFASNEFLGKSINVSIDRAKRIVSSLYNKKYIDRKVIYKNGTMEVDKRILKPTIKTTKVEISKEHIPSVENNLGVGVNTPLGGGESNHIEKRIEKRSNNSTTSTVSFTDLINSYTKNNELAEALEGFIDMRNEMTKSDDKNKLLTVGAFKTILKKLNEYGKNDNDKINILDDAIVNCSLMIQPIDKIYEIQEYSLNKIKKASTWNVETRANTQKVILHNDFPTKDSYGRKMEIL
ncbi:hypothetical protein PN294_14855 [Romboutsia sp. 1001216sp1]|uniref:hypothetical protein n=1 Tax=unclassified Romboutsia TaxID=2626894 RepID=UPI0018A070DA|nr:MULTISPECIES: hypothetical protein [unclassified Romboutsia]MDB8803443.1 hypothetical protein [Romboutsia sp. 1001216sp1]MDB8803452.1 hypothetical protein [Romboutsia sp. 1001216sp1]MDB8814833.1 hypothetical protein [Romboutsia sp. 1001216sp1]MDB8814842.1 hypothetical protein [Romboutsia sp. 1001216sp1]